jgi:hypothetical protein
LTQRPLESLIVQTLSSTLPLLPDDLHEPSRQALLQLEALSDDELWQVERSTFPSDQYERYRVLREQQRAAVLSAEAQSTLEQLAQAADLLTLRKAYAAVLLKWRGHRLPSLSDLEA